MRRRAGRNGRRLALLAGVAALAGAASQMAWAATTHKIGMANSAYGPDRLTAKVGDRLVFANDDFENHWVYVPTVGFQVSKANMKPDDKLELALAQPGRFTVLCALHPAMSATVTVEK